MLGREGELEAAGRSRGEPSFFGVLYRALPDLQPMKLFVLCGRVVGTEVDNPLVRVSPIWSWTRGSWSTCRVLIAGPRLCLAVAWAAWTIKPTLNGNDEGPGVNPGLFPCALERFLRAAST